MSATVQDDMEDIEVATKAPESDAQEDKQQGTAASSQAQHAAAATQTAPALGEHCVSDRPAPSGTEPKGEITSLGGIQTYISKPTFYPSQPAKLLLLLSPGTGIHSLNNQLQADEWAAQGYVVIMPDQFNGDAIPNLSTSTNASTSPDPSTSQTGAEEGAGEGEAASGWLDKLKLSLVETAKSFRIDMWLARHTPETVLPRLQTVLSAAKDVFADAIAFGDGVYGAGYCFGGRFVILLLSDHSNLPSNQSNGEGETEDLEAGVKNEARLKKGVVAHATSVSKDDFTALPKERTLGVVAVREDALFPDEVREWGVKLAGEEGARVVQRVWEGVPHGFAVVGEYKDQKIGEAQREAFECMRGVLADE